MEGPAGGQEDSGDNYRIPTPRVYRIRVNPNLIKNPKPETRNPKPETRNPKSENRNPNPKSEILDNKPETRNPRPAPLNATGAPRS